MSIYIPTIGIETHVQLKTKTKLFSSVDNDARLAEPNSLISHIDTGMPGALPVLNEKAVELTIRAGLALNGQPQKFSKFDRKHYFYPDLPKGYQISQYDAPLVKGGHIELELEGAKIKIGITRIHLEEDAGKIIHPAGADYSLVDLNRAGTPLIEIVGAPELHSAAAAKAYCRELYLTMKYAGVSDVDLYHGHMRFDVNVSLSKDISNLGKRAEVKNLNSFRAVESAINYEIKRQTELLKKGEQPEQETRGWDETKQKTTSQRGKEEAEDYRYMPEPDIPPVQLSDEYISRVKAKMPALPAQLRQKLNKLSIENAVIEDLLDRPQILHQVLEVLDRGGAAAARQAAFWALHSQAGADDSTETGLIDSSRIVELAKLVESGQLNSNAAQRIYDELSSSDKVPQQLAEELKLLQISDEAAIEQLVDKIIKENPEAVQDIKAGQAKAISFLIGQVMAKSNGQANPALVQKILQKKLGKTS